MTTHEGGERNINNDIVHFIGTISILVSCLDLWNEAIVVT